MVINVNSKNYMQYHIQNKCYCSFTFHCDQFIKRHVASHEDGRATRDAICHGLFERTQEMLYGILCCQPRIIVLIRKRGGKQLSDVP